MDIGSRRGYPSSALSNFSPHPFTFRGSEVISMEGFLQGLKFKNPDMQLVVFRLCGLKAKYKGKKKRWWRTQTLWFQGRPIHRHSKEYQELLDEAFLELNKNAGFRRALLATGDAILTHSHGKNNPSRTVLTEREFCSRLMKLRIRLQIF